MKKIDVPEAIWDDVKRDYIMTSISIRGVCKKHSVPFNQCLRRSKEEDWNSLKDQLSHETMHKSIEKISDFRSDEVSRAYFVASKILDKLGEVVDQMDATSPTVLGEIKDATYSLSKLKEIGLFRAALDEEEQIARIKKLQKDASDEQTESTITVHFAEGIEEFTK